MKKNKILDVIAIISTLGIVAWMITDFFGGMVIFLFSYGLIILPFVILYIFSFISTIILLIIKGFKKNRIKALSHIFLILIIIAFNIFQSEIFKSKIILKAILKDDQYNYTLIFRENNKCDNIVNGIFGYKEVFHGKYELKGDTIIFLKKPYDNNFIPDTIFINKKEKAIFILKDSTGNFSITKEWLNHFEIE
jgi:hypothetical protein